MSKPWYHSLLLIAAHQSAWPDSNMPGIADRWHKMGFNTEQLSLPITHPLYGVYVKRSKTLGTRLIQYTNIHALGPDCPTAAQWAQKTAQGEYHRIYSTCYLYCLNSPWREQFFEEVEALARMELDGIFLDGPSMGPGGCFCTHCRERYRALYGRDLTPGADLFEFYCRTHDAFLSEVYRRFKALKPQGLVYMNFDIMTPTVGYFTLPEALAYNDVIGTEGGFMFGGPPKQASLWRPGVSAKIMEAIVPDKPRVIFMAADQKPWGEYMHTPAETTLCIASTVANGANLWYGPHGRFPGVLETPGCRAAAELVGFLARHAAYYAPSASAARVAVMYSMATERFYRTTIAESDLYGRKQINPLKVSGNMTDAFYGFCDMLTRSAIPYDVVTDLDFTLGRWSSYDCIFLPTSACLSDRVVAALKAHVVRGGTLVSSFDSSLYTETGKRRNDFGLREVLGVSWLGKETPYFNWNYFSIAMAHPMFKGVDIPYLPAPAFGLDIQTDPQAQVLARFHAPLAGRYDALQPQALPAIVRRQFGRGNAFYLAGTFGEMANSYCPVEYRRMIGNLARQYSRQPARLENALGNVEMNVRKQRGRLVIHLVNYAGLTPRPFEVLAPQGGLRLCLDHGRKKPGVYALRAGRPCAVKRQGAQWVCALPVLRDYETIVVT